MANPTQNPEKQTLTEIVRGAGRVGKEIAIGGKELAISVAYGMVAPYAISTTLRRAMCDAAYRTEEITAGDVIRFMISSPTAGLSLGLLGFSIGFYPDDPTFTILGKELVFPGRMATYAFIGGNLISAGYELGRYVKHRVIERNS